MPLSVKLLIIVMVKLMVIFFVLRLFFFPDILHSRFTTDKDRSNHVGNELAGRKQ